MIIPSAETLTETTLPTYEGLHPCNRIWMAVAPQCQGNKLEEAKHVAIDVPCTIRIAIEWFSQRCGHEATGGKTEIHHLHRHRSRARHLWIVLRYAVVIILAICSFVAVPGFQLTVIAAPGPRTENPGAFLMWPLPPSIRLTSITRLPDTAWTHNFLGIADCPAYPALIDPGNWSYNDVRGYYPGNRQLIKPGVSVNRVKWMNADNSYPWNNIFACYSASSVVNLDHDGTDISATNGTHVLAAAGGYVHNTQPLTIRHDNVNDSGQTWYTIYRHVTNVRYAKAVWVSAGDWIANVGSGHLHFETRIHSPSTSAHARNHWGIDQTPWTGCLWKDASRCAIPNNSIDNPPSIAQNIYGNGQVINSSNPGWTFTGSASDDAGLSLVEHWSTGNNGNYSVSQAASGTSGSWSFTRNGMKGSNVLHFRARDNSNQVSGEIVLYLNIDTAAPTVNSSLSGTPGETDWYRSPVSVSLQANDTGSGDWTAGVASLHYQLDGGAWQTAGKSATVPINADGTHTVTYYARDTVDNVSSPLSLTVKIDATPPGAPGLPAETHSIASGVWQRDLSDAAFTWPPASDSGSGIAGYIVDWGQPAAAIVATPAFDPPPVRSGSYTLTVRAIDRAGNIGPAGPPFVFNYDGTPPLPPEVQNDDGAASGVWQRSVSTARFSWPPARDEGSGAQRYYVYWGPDPNGVSATSITARTFSSSTPIAPANGAVTYYLRARSEDGVGWQSEWSTYVLRYDAAPPTVTLIANYGQPVARQVNINLRVNASDIGSGVTRMRLSTEGAVWTDWMTATPELTWEIPSVGRRSYDLYAQVVDGAGNVSEIVSDTVFLDVNAPYPQSASVFLWNSTFPVASVSITSTNWRHRATLGETFEARPVSNAHYRLTGGYETSVLGSPMVPITHTSYQQTHVVLSSGGTGAEPLTSTSWKMQGSIGQPTQMAVVSSTRFVATLGYWGTLASTAVITDPPDPPQPVLPECEFFSLSINDGALYTNSPAVGLSLCGPNPTSVMLSNDGGFSGATWQNYTRTLPWAITTYGQHVLPRFVYARYRDSAGQIYGTFFDDIIYDPTAPSGQSSFSVMDLLPGARLSGHQPTAAQVVNAPNANLYMVASDDNSGLTEMQIGFDPAFTDSTWQPYAAMAPITASREGMNTIYVRFRDNAGNVSGAATSSLLVDTTPPVGSSGAVRVVEPAVGPNAVTATLQFAVSDVASSVSHVRVGRSPVFTDAIWVPYAPQLPFNIHPAQAGTTLYAQFRDVAGNVSAVYTTSYQVDTTPPAADVALISMVETTVTLRITATDDLSGISQMWLSPDYDFARDVTVMAYQPDLTWNTGADGIVFIKFIDGVGNTSEPYWAPNEFAPDEPYFELFLPIVKR